MGNLEKLSTGDVTTYLSLIGMSEVTPLGIVALVVSLIVGIIGFLAIVRGFKERIWRQVFIGLALSAYPYFIPNPIVSILVGFGLTALLFFWRD